MRFKEKRYLCIGLACAVSALALPGCAGDTSSSTAETETQDTAPAAASLDTEPQEETVTQEETDTQQEADTHEETSVTEETGQDQGDVTVEKIIAEDGLTLAQTYNNLMQLDLSQAREYFGVSEDDSLSDEDFDEFCNDIFIDGVTSDQLTLNLYLKDPAEAGIENMEDITYDWTSLRSSDQEIDAFYEDNLEQLMEMLAYPYESLGSRNKLIFDKMYYEYLIAMWGASVTSYSSVLSTSSSLLDQLNTTFYEYIFDDEDDVKTYARLLDYLPDVLRKIPEDILNQSEKLGYAPTDFMVDSALDTLNSLMETSGNPFIDGYNDKIDLLDMDDDKKSEYKEANRKFYEDEVIPALEEVYASVEELSGKNEEGKGLCEYEGGLDYYEYLVENAVGANMSIDELMELLDDDLNTKIDKLIKYATLNTETYEDYYEGNLTVPGNDDPEQILEYLVENLRDEFPSLDDAGWTVSALSESLEVDYILAYYLVPRIDDGDTNTIRYNGSALADDSITLFTTIAHEGYPGHMLQNHVMSASGCKNIEKIISHTSYSEGWARYIEGISLECSGLSEAAQQIVILDSSVSYELYGYLDLAVNGKGWSRTKAGEYAESVGFIEEVGEYIYDVVISDPGVYLPYSAGMLITGQIIEDYMEESGCTRAQACEEYLKTGDAPFSVVEKYMGFEY